MQEARTRSEDQEVRESSSGCRNRERASQQNQISFQNHGCTQSTLRRGKIEIRTVSKDEINLLRDVVHDEQDK
nr:hypothetical protein [Tanacetum cinerariifolium]